MRAADVQQIIINLLRAVDSPDSLQLTPGQVISVLLKDVQAKTALLSYQGRDITARLEVDIPAGERLRCLVEGEKDGQIVLKVLGGTGEGVTGQALRNILKSLGLPGDQLNVRLLQEMMKQEMPLTPDYARLLSVFARSGDVPQDDLRFAVFMLKQGIPLNREMYQAVKQLFTDMKFLQAGLDKLLSETGPLAGGSGAAAELGRMAARVNEAITGMQIMSSDGHEVLTAKLGDIFRQLLPQTGSAGALQPLETTPSGTAQQGPAQQGSVQAGAGQPYAVSAGKEQPGAGQSAAATDGAGLLGAGQPGSAQADTARTGTAQPGEAVLARNSSSSGSTTQPGATNAELPGSRQLVTPGEAGGPEAEPAQKQAAAALAGPADQENPAKADGLSESTRTAAQRNEGQHDAAVNREEGKIGDIARRIADRLSELADRYAAPIDRTARDSLAARIHSVLEQTVPGESQQPDLKTLVERLVTALSADGKQEHSELLQAARNVMDRLEFMQNFNRAEPGRENLIMVYSTVRFEDKQEPLRLLVNYRYDGKNKKKDFTSCKVEVKLHTPGLGLVRCELQVNSRNLTVQFVSDNEKAAGIIDGAKEALGRRLEELKYQVKMLPSKVQAPEQAGSFPDEKPDIPGLFRVNLRV